MGMEKTVMVDNKPFCIRKYDTETDGPLVRELWRIAFGKEIPESLWRWKYIDMPYDLKLLICTTQGGTPVVFYGGRPATSTIYGRETIMIHLTDIMSHPDYRKTGLFIHTANAYYDIFGDAEPAVGVMYGFPGEYHFDIGAKYLKYSKLGAGAAYFEAAPAAMAARRIVIADVQFEGTIEPINAPDSCFDRIWKSVMADYPVSVARDTAYMKWRFYDSPIHTYDVFAWRTTSTRNYDAFAVLRIDGEEAVMVDFLIPNAEVLFHTFVVRIAGVLEKKGVTLLKTWVPQAHFSAQHFISVGFDLKQEPLGIIPTIRLFDGGLDIGQVCADFFYTMGDCDLM